MTKMRDRLARSLANLSLSLATPQYRQFIVGSIEYGMRAAAEDVRVGRDAPSDWRQAPKPYPTTPVSDARRSGGSLQRNA